MEISFPVLRTNTGNRRDPSFSPPMCTHCADHEICFPLPSVQTDGPLVEWALYSAFGVSLHLPQASITATHPWKPSTGGVLLLYVSEFQTPTWRQIDLADGDEEPITSQHQMIAYGGAIVIHGFHFLFQQGSRVVFVHSTLIHGYMCTLHNTEVTLTD